MSYSTWLGALRIDPVALGVRLVDGRDFAIEAAGERVRCWSPSATPRGALRHQALVDDVAGTRTRVTVLQDLGLADQRVFDWQGRPDARSSPSPDDAVDPFARRGGRAELVRFHELVRTLRVRCPWDREQSHETLTRHLLEETYEVLEASTRSIRETRRPTSTSPMSWAICCSRSSSIGARVGDGQFTIADIARGIPTSSFAVIRTCSAVEADTARRWSRTGNRSRSREGHVVVDGGHRRQPAPLLYATKLQKKAASVGFDGDVSGAFPKVAEETAELATVIESGDARRSPMSSRPPVRGDNVARHVRIDPEAAYAPPPRNSGAVRRVRALAAGRGLELTELDRASSTGCGTKSRPRIGEHRGERAIVTSVSRCTARVIAT